MTDIDDTHGHHMSRSGRKAAKRGSGALLGMIALGVAGFFAWRNRDRIAEKARPMLEDAKTKSRDMIDKAAARSHDAMDTAATRSHEMMDKAAATGHRLVDTAKTKGQAAAAKARAREPAAPETPGLEVH